MQKYKIIAPFFIVLIIDVIGFGMISPVLAPMVISPEHSVLGSHSTLEARHWLYGMLLALAPLCFMIGAPLMGFLSDYFGRRRLLLMCLMGTLIGFILYAVSFSLLSPLILILAALSVGLTSGSQSIAQAAMADISEGVQKTIHISWIALALTIGLVLGPFIGGFFSTRAQLPGLGIATPFYIAIILALFNLVLVYRWVRETRRYTTTASFHLPVLFQRYFYLIFHSPARQWYRVFFLFELGWSLYFQSLALMLVEKYHFNGEQVGWFSAYVGIVLSVGLLVLVRYTARYCRLTSAVVVSLLAGSGALVVNGLFPGLSLQGWMAIPIALSVAVAYASLISLISDGIGPEEQGLVMGSADSLLSLAFAISSVVGSYLIYLNPLYPQLLAGGILGIAALGAQPQRLWKNM